VDQRCHLPKAPRMITRLARAQARATANGKRKEPGTLATEKADSCAGGASGVFPRGNPGASAPPALPAASQPKVVRGPAELSNRTARCPVAGMGSRGTTPSAMVTSPAACPRKKTKGEKGRETASDCPTTKSAIVVDWRRRRVLDAPDLGNRGAPNRQVISSPERSPSPHRIGETHESCLLNTSVGECPPMIEDGIEHAAEGSSSGGAGGAAPKGLKPASGRLC